jgi:undecaprenyl-diphosphatase
MVSMTAVKAFFCVRWLLRYISSHDFSAFAGYRIAFGYTGVVRWAAR